MLNFDRPEMVRQFRQTFENEMTSRLTGVVEEVTGREVVAYQSQFMVDPDIEVEMFVFDSAGERSSTRRDAEGQLQDEAAGAATDQDAFDEPAGSGQQQRQPDRGAREGGGRCTAASCERWAILGSNLGPAGWIEHSCGFGWPWFSSVRSVPLGLIPD